VYTFTPLDIKNADFHEIKKIQKCKINYDGLTFSSSFLVIEEVKDEMWKHNGRSCFSIQV